MGTDQAFDLSSKRRHHAPRQTYYLLLHRGCFFTRQPRRPRPNVDPDPHRRFDKLSNLVPIYVAWKKGLFREQGLELLPVYMQARTSLAALASKQIGYITQTGSSLTAIARGLPARLVMVFTDKTHHVLVVKPEITSPAQLRGRVVAISQPGGTVHRELLMILDKLKIDPNEVKTASLGMRETA